MKRLKLDAQAGLIRLRVETLDDLWTLQTLVAIGDLVTMDSLRTAETATDKLREGKAEKRRMRLGVRVDSVGWHDFDDHVRILGTIESGPQDHGRHHTHVVREGDTLDIQKQGGVQRWQRALIDKAVKASEAPRVVMVAIDDSDAQFAILRGYGIQWLGNLPAAGQGKRFGDPAQAKRAFYDEALRSLKALREGNMPLIVVGPGWWREEFLARVAEREPALVEGAVTDGTSQAGRAGIQEALRRGVVDRVADKHRVQQEMDFVEEVMRRIAIDGAVAYGVQEVQAAAAAGAIEAILVTDERARGGTDDALLRQAEHSKADIHILSTAHEAGQRLAHLGGVAALLRFAMS